MEEKKQYGPVKEVIVGVIDKPFGPKEYCYQFSHSSDPKAFIGGYKRKERSIDELAASLVENLMLEEEMWPSECEKEGFLKNKGIEFWGTDGRAMEKLELDYLKKMIEEYSRLP